MPCFAFTKLAEWNTSSSDEHHRAEEASLSWWSSKQKPKVLDTLVDLIPPIFPLGFLK